MYSKWMKNIFQEVNKPLSKFIGYIIVYVPQ